MRAGCCVGHRGPDSFHSCIFRELGLFRCVDFHLEPLHLISMQLVCLKMLGKSLLHLKKKKKLSIPFRLPFRLIKLRPRKAARREKQAADCRCLGKGNPLPPGSVVSMGTALLASAGCLPQTGKMYRKENYGEKERSKKRL